VAHIIAKGEPPEWLVQNLETFSKLVGPDRQITPETYQRFKKRIERMREGTDTLLELLPVTNNMPEPFPAIVSSLEMLPEFRAWLDELIGKPTGGRSPHFGRELCADLIVYFWRRCHGKAEPRSHKAYEACEEYWQRYC